MADSLQSLLDDAVARGVAPGLSAAVLAADGEVRLAQSGKAGPGAVTDLIAESRFWIASCTKAVTSVAALRLVEEGRLDLDAPVGERLPGLAHPVVLTGFDAQGAPRLAPAQSPITLRHLLSHTSGLAYDFFSADLARALAAQGRSMMSGGEPEIPLTFEPGGGWQYGIGIDWAGKLIEQAAGVPLAEHLQRTLFEPLGMSHTGFFPLPEAPRVAMAQKLGPGRFESNPFALPTQPNFMMGGGGLFSTPADFIKFLAAIAAGGAPLLRPETFREMMQSQSDDEDAGRLRSVAPALSNDFTPLAGRRPRHGLAGLVNLDPVPGGRSAGSLSWAGLANCYYWADPKAHVAGVLMAQMFPFADSETLQTFDAMEYAAYR